MYKQERVVDIYVCEDECAGAQNRQDKVDVPEA